MALGPGSCPKAMQSPRPPAPHAGWVSGDFIHCLTHPCSCNKPLPSDPLINSNKLTGTLDLGRTVCLVCCLPGEDQPTTYNLLQTSSLIISIPWNSVAPFPLCTSTKLRLLQPLQFLQPLIRVCGNVGCSCL